MNRRKHIFLLPVGEKEGPAPKAWEEAEDQVHQFRDLLPLTLPLLTQWAPPSPPWGEGNFLVGDSAIGNRDLRP